MSNDLSIAAMRSQMANYRQNMPVQVGRTQFLKFAKGDWLYGKDDNEILPNSRFVIAADSLGHGYKAWHERKVAHEVRRKVFEALPAIDELPDVETDIDKDTGAPRGYQFQVGFVLACIEGPTKGMTFQYWTETHGGIGAHTAIVEAVITQLALDPSTPNPIVKLGVNSYAHSKVEFGRVKIPVFEIVGWTGDGVAAPAKEEPKAIEKAPEPVVEPVVEAEEAEEVDELTALRAKLAALEASSAPASDAPRRRAAPKV
jgi:hypothetical protein